MKLSLAFLALSVAAVSAVSLRSDKIVSGTEAALGEFPYFASIYYNNAHVCGAVIYNDNWVITTAKCVTGRATDLVGYSVYAGQVNLLTAESTEQSPVARTIVVHLQYDAATGANNIALVQIRGTFDFAPGTRVSPIHYDEINPNVPDAFFAGFGAYSESTNQPFSRLLKTTLMYNQDCSSYGADFNIGTMICAASAAASPCHYDEGGPMIQFNPTTGLPVAKGIMSRYNGCAAGSPVIFTRLTPFYDFITLNAGDPAPTPGLTPAPTTVVDTTMDMTTLPPDTVAPKRSRFIQKH